MIYLDHAATTPILPEVFDAMLPWMNASTVGNPSSVHSQGLAAKRAIDHAREQVADLIHAHPDEIIFTSGGTEANALIAGLTSGLDFAYLSYFEHKSCHSAFQRNWDNIGFFDFFRSRLPLADELEKNYLNRKKSVVSCMWANNETGHVLPVKDVGAVCYKYGAFFHTDAVQAVGHIPVNVVSYHVDAMSMSAHKFGGPQGIGALYLSRSASRRFNLKKFNDHSKQEFGLRTGTQNVAGIVGMGKAAEIAKNSLYDRVNKAHELRSLFIETLNTYLPHRIVMNSGVLNLPNIISLTINGVHSETLIHTLDQMGVCISAGAACDSGSVSSVLLNLGLSQDEAASTVRVSLGYGTTDKEVQKAVDLLVAAVRQIDTLFKDI